MTQEAMSIDEIETAFARQVTATFVPLQTSGEIDAEGLAELVRLAKAGARALAGRTQLPRAFLNELYVATRVLRAEQTHRPDPGLADAANELEMVFGLILRGEEPESRQSGVPRVV